MKKLRELILELAVRGKLVPQDPTDEPASVLLERIAEEKAQLIKDKKIKKNRKQPAITQEEIYFSVPKSWGYARLEDVYDVRDGTHDSPKPTSEGYPLVTSKNLSSGKLDLSEVKLISEEDHMKVIERSRVDRNDILFAMIGSIGNPVIVDTEVEFSIKNVGLFKYYNPQDSSPNYLNYFLKYAAEIMKKQSAGGVQPFVSLGKLRGFVMPTPPLAEQHRIVAKVDELMTLCDQLEQQTEASIEAHQTLVEVLLNTLTSSENADELMQNWARISEHFDTLFTTEASIDQLKQTILQLAVMGKLVPQDPTDEPAAKLLERIAEEKAQLIKDKKIKKQKALLPIAEDEKPFELPMGWEWCRFEDVVDIQSGITKGRKLVNRALKTIPYLSVANVQRGFLNLSNVKEIELPVDELEKFGVQNGDLLITEGGDWDKVGRTAIWRDEIEYVAHQNHVFKARPFLREQSEVWLEMYLNAPFARDYFAGSSKQTTNLASINKTQLRGCFIAVPPKKEKQNIVRKVDDLMVFCDQLIELLQESQITQLHLTNAIVEQAANHGR
ncbi:restriction endonuclease subunit S [Vibrio artabrorum]